MARLTLTTAIAAPPDIVFDVARDIGEHERASDGNDRAVAGRTSGLIERGETVTWRGRHFGVPFTMTSKIVEMDRPRRFVDVMQRGPFARWHHEHRFAATPDGGTVMTDIVDYAAPLGLVGIVVDAVVLRRHLTALLTKQNRHLTTVAEGRARAT